MMKSALNRVILGMVSAVTFFLVLAFFVPVDRLIVTLNGAFFGASTAIMMAYGRLMWNAILGVRPYDRVRQMTLGFFLCWVAYGLSVSVSFYYRASGIDVPSVLVTAASRYVAVIAAILQVTAPDFGLGIFHGRDRRVLYTGLLVGTVVALVAIVTQTEELLAG